MLLSPIVAFLPGGGSVGTGEWIVMAVVILIVVGPKRLPEIARKLGRTMEMFRRAADEFKDQLMTMDQEHDKTPAPDTTDTTPYDEAAGYNPNPDGDPYSDGDPYPDRAEYPGNEDTANSWSSDSLSDVPAEPGADDASSVELTDTTPDAPAHDDTETAAT